jgi:riboflavin kinase/FMN adenylyltransferase
VGVRPTFDGEGVTVEAHLLDFDRDIYGQQLTVTFETRLRAEKKFNGIQELIAQIGADAQAGREYLSR